VYAASARRVDRKPFALPRRTPAFSLAVPIMVVASRLIVFAVSIFGLAMAQSVWPVELGVSRYFHDTPQGALHYVVRGDPSKEPPLVLFHSDPRSTTEFRHFVEAFSRPRPFIAVDFYGMGASDDCRCKTDEFVRFETYAAEVLDILEKHGAKKFVPLGILKGTNPALALANVAGPSMVEALVQIEPLLLSKSAAKYMNTDFIPSVVNPALSFTGEHLIKAWNDASAAPFAVMGPSEGQLDNDQDDIGGNFEKTMDALRCRNAAAGSGRSKNQMAWVAYNDAILPAFKSTSKFSRFLFIYSPHIEAVRAKYGLTPHWSRGQLEEALTGAEHKTVWINATEGMMSQNATLIAQHVEEFLSAGRLVV